jgi:hypothetical protein
VYLFNGDLSVNKYNKYFVTLLPIIDGDSFWLRVSVYEKLFSPAGDWSGEKMLLSCLTRDYKRFEFWSFSSSWPKNMFESFLVDTKNKTFDFSEEFLGEIYNIIGKWCEQNSVTSTGFDGVPFQAAASIIRKYEEVRFDIEGFSFKEETTIQL